MIMEADISQVKSQLLRELWGPYGNKIGEINARTKRKNKELDVLTLTSDFNYEEIEYLVNSRISKYEKIVAWTNNSTKKMRLEPYVKVRILNQAKFEDINLGRHRVGKLFPFDIINLDYLSQDDWDSNSKLLKVVGSFNEILKSQKNNSHPNFAIFLTVPLTEEPIRKSDACGKVLPVSFKEEYSSYPNEVVGEEMKARFLENLFLSLLRENGLEASKEELKIVQTPLKTFSIAIITRVRTDA